MTVTKQVIIDFLRDEFPQCEAVVESVDRQSAIVRYPISTEHLRPGGTVSGPTMMELADVALYVAIQGALGITPLAVTTSLSFNFLRKPSSSCDLIGHCKLIKVGRVLVVGEVSIFSEGDDRAVAHAVGTYSIPRIDVTGGE